MFINLIVLHHLIDLNLNFINFINHLFHFDYLYLFYHFMYYRLLIRYLLSVFFGIIPLILLIFILLSFIFQLF
jgi:hypothetical protein